MSVMLLSPNHVATVAMGITKLLNRARSVEQVNLTSSTWEALKFAFEGCGTQVHYRLYLYKAEAVFEVLAELNARAFAGRYYTVEAIDYDDVTNQKDLLKTPEIVNNHYCPGANWFAWTKLLESFIYQCSEDINSRSPILASLLPLLDEIKLFIFNRQDAYDAAPWTI